MTPKQRAVCALELRQPDDIVPTMEIEFQLHKQLVGQELILGKEFASLSGAERERAIAHNVDIYCREAEILDYSAITIDPLYWAFGHGVGTRFYYATVEDQIDIARVLYDRIGSKVFLAVSMDATFGIPLAEDMENFVYDMYENEGKLLDIAEARLADTLEKAKRLIDAGVGVIYCCSDYCFGTAPFFSRELFGKFVQPFLKRQVQVLKSAGAYVIKHTDGNIMPIADMILDCKPHAIQSIDPMAGMDIADFKQRYGRQVCIMGNVNVAYLENGTKEQVEQSARYALESAMPGGGYIFSTCNTVFSEVPLENYRVMLDVRSKYGRYDA